MLPLWIFSALLLSLVLGNPLYNNTQNRTRLDNNSSFNSSSAPLQDRNLNVLFHPLSGCMLSTCHMHELDSRLQQGNENAGDQTHDPYGPGKK
ncbi:uncharacterized protein zgc:193726 [Silurus meridionalis]|uniref:Uncharacterized protein n=1 Tax=Silurus meridionalis TaxID=175797 RepID=A0A8T0B7D4_SILME|nr:uncharacterized protein zgc:193726 [Silurus meridionalis]KAF7702462.1 hypothetical protein HF521_001745 [Silurus meridionalis]